MDAFGVDFVLDYSNLNQLRIVIGKGIDQLPTHPRELRRALKDHIPLEEQGDGLRAFLGILTAMRCTDRPVLLIDEPETFLHPPQARRLGSIVGNLSAEGRQIFVSTHSSDVLRGILSSGAPQNGMEGKHELQIVRLSRTDGRSRVTILDPKHLTEVAEDPVLSSARFLEGLFYSGVAVVEGDSDARFYQAVADRIGQQSTVTPHFLVAQGKQAVPRLLSKYRELEVPAAAILDFDVLREEALLRDLLAAQGCPISEIGELVAQRELVARTIAGSNTENHRAEELKKQLARILTELDKEWPSEFRLSKARRALVKASGTADSWRDAKRLGLQSLAESNAATALLTRLATRGLFVCPVGELEGYFRDLIGSGDKQQWLSKGIRAVGSLEVRANEEPWALVTSLLSFLRKPVHSASGKTSEVSSG